MLTFKRAAAMMAGVAGSVVATRYRRDLRGDRARLDAVERSTVDTAFGEMEYAQAGDGPPALVIHGVFGGRDFGIGVGRGAMSWPR